MQFKGILSLDHAVTEAIQNDEEDKMELLSRIIMRERDVVLTLLNSYDYFDDTRGEIHDFEISDDSLYIENDGTGGFKVEYEVHYYFGCEDINRQYDQSMDIGISINFERKEAEIIGEFWNEREPDEF